MVVGAGVPPGVTVAVGVGVTVGATVGVAVDVAVAVGVGDGTMATHCGNLNLPMRVCHGALGSGMV